MDGLAPELGCDVVLEPPCILSEDMEELMAPNSLAPWMKAGSTREDGLVSEAVPAWGSDRQLTT